MKHLIHFNKARKNFLSNDKATILTRNRIRRNFSTHEFVDRQPSSRSVSSLVMHRCRFFSSSSNGENDNQNTFIGDENHSTSNSSNHAFDRKLKVLQRDGAARVHSLYGNNENDYDYFRNEIASRLVDRLDDIKKEEGFPLALDIGSGPGYIYKAICSDDAFDMEGGIGGVRKLVQLDSSKLMLHRDDDEGPVEGNHRCGTYKLHADEEGTLPFPDGTFDLVISSVAIHWINDIPKLFTEVKRILKPDGCFMFAMIGGSTLPELRISMTLAELERDGGVSPHVGPYVELSDVGSLLQSAGFALPTIDVDTVKIGYPNAMVLMEHLQRMGENNACLTRKKQKTSIDTFLSAACIYDEMFSDSDEHEAGVGIEASVQVIYAIGWSPHESQQKPSARGSATHKVGSVEVSQHTTTSSKTVDNVEN